MWVCLCFALGFSPVPSHAAKGILASEPFRSCFPPPGELDLQAQSSGHVGRVSRPVSCLIWSLVYLVSPALFGSFAWQ